MKAWLKELLAKQTELDAALDLHKSDEQAAAAGHESDDIPGLAPFAGP